MTGKQGLLTAILASLGLTMSAQATDLDLLAIWQYGDPRIHSYQSRSGADLASRMRQNVRIQQLRRQAMARPENLALRIRVGDALLEDGRLTQASMEYWGAARQEPISREAVDALATALLLSGDTANAIRVLEKLLEAGESGPGLRLRLAAAYYAQERFTDAAEAIEAAMVSDEFQAQALLDMALVHVAQGRREKALEQLSGCLARPNPNPAVLTALAIAYAHLDHPDQTLNALEELASQISQAELALILSHEVFTEWAKSGMFDEMFPAIEQESVSPEANVTE